MTDNDQMDYDASEHKGMNKQPQTMASRRRRRLAGAAALLLAGGIAGGALAATSSASAAGITGTASLPVASVPRPSGQADTATPVRAGERAETGSDLATLKAAALKAVPGGTVYRVETDVDGATYEAHMSKADGTHVTVKFGKNFSVTAVQDGMGVGGPSVPGAPNGPGGGTPSTSSGAGI